MDRIHKIHVNPLKRQYRNIVITVLLPQMHCIQGISKLSFLPDVIRYKALSRRNAQIKALSPTATRQ